MSNFIPKNIVLIGPAHPLRGGLASFNERLAKELQEQGHTITIYTFSLQYPSFLFPGTTQYSTEKAPANLKIEVNINSVNPFNWIKIGNRLKNKKPDLIIVRYWLPFMGPCLGTILRKVKKNKLTKVVCIADNIIPHEKRPGDNIITSYFIKAIDGFVTMSENVMNDLRTFTSIKPARLMLHPLYDNFGDIIPKNEAREFLKIPTEQKIILFFGFIRNYKGLDILLNSMADDRIKEQNISLLIAGEFYQDRNIYMDLISKLGIQKNIILHTNFINDSEVKYYCCAADLIVQPYRNATQSGVTPLAYHFEKPMVVTNVGALPKMVIDGKTGLIAEPNHISIADKIINYFNLGEEYFKKNIQQEKLKYSWHIFKDSILNLYSDIQK